MQDIIRQFYELMASHGCPLKNESDLIADDKKHRVACALDKGTDKTLIYQLRIDGDFAVGWFHSFKFGDSHYTHKFFSKPGKHLSQAEKEIWQAKADKARREAKIREKQRDAWQRRLAVKLTRLSDSYKKTSDHPYLAAKNLKTLVFHRAKGNQLIIPVYQPDGKVWSFQTIDERGKKMFTAGGRIKGGFFILGDSTDTDRIVIGEGFATMATIHEHTGLPCVCAFNAGNLLPVAQHMRSRFPNAKIIIAADNDRFTKNSRGEFFNVGIVKSTIAANEVDGKIIFPLFPENNKFGTDWNDYVTAYGPTELLSAVGLGKQLEAARDGSASFDVVSMAAAPIPQENLNWRVNLSVDKEGNPVKNSLRNAILYLQFHQDYEQLFKLNEFHKEIFITRPAPWHDASEFRVKRLDDYEIICCAAHMEQHGLTIDLRKMLSAIVAAAEYRKFHPAREYFDSIVWDGNSRLKTWLSYYLGAEGDDSEYLAFIGTKWLTAAVKRVYEPGCKFDHVLVIEGLQGKGKSAALECLATFGKEKQETYFSDNIRIADIQNKDTILLLQGSIIVELAELAGFSKKDDEEIKGWVTLKKDRCRKPYDKTITEFPRQFVLSATTNNHEYLKDPTGNRRYWPFKSSSLDIEAIRNDREQLWAEAVHHYKSGLYIGPTEEEMELATIAQEKRRSVDAWEDDILQYAQEIDPLNSKGVTIKRIMNKMGLALRDQDQKSTRRITAILQQNGYRNEVRWDEQAGKSQRMWVKQERN